jgi:FMN-dependent oxidoreductase (nitrilotriacetate monooxygenase family)
VSGRRFLLSAFTGLGIPAHAPGLWRHPDAGRIDHDDLRAWIELAVDLEQLGFDLLFFADAVGIYDVFGGSAEQCLIDAIGIPSNDPSVIISALAAATSDLGFAFTSSTLQEHPFNLARKLSTLDHLTNGRIGWNIVTGYAPNASRNFGLDGVVGHDVRYAQADEYVSVAYALWEASWDDDALRADPNGAWVDPAGVRPIDHVGPSYRVAGPHLPAPSRQRTPTLFQAGASEAGREFAARHAEGVFMIAFDQVSAAAQVADLRRRAVRAGRRADDLVVLQGLWFVIGSTEAEARRRERELLERVSPEGVLADLSGKIGVDLGDIDLDTPVRELRVEGVQGIIDSLREANPAGTFRDMAGHLLSARIVGTPEQIADELASWSRAGVDGIQVMDVPAHGAFREFGEHVIPALRARGMTGPSTPGITLRERLLGRGARAASGHPAAAWARRRDTRQPATSSTPPTSGRSGSALHSSNDPS